MRIYIPATTSTVRNLMDSGSLGPAPITAFAVTQELRDWYVNEDDEALEYAAFTLAARGSLRLIDADDGAARRRVVISADVAPGTVTVRDDLDRGVVSVDIAIPIAAVACAHMDDDDARPAVNAAAEAVIAADLGSSAAQDVVDDAEGYELSWYARQEIGVALELMD